MANVMRILGCACGCAALVALVACRSYERAAPASPKPPKVKYNPKHDQELNNIFRLASEGRWEAAEQDAMRLAADTPGDVSTQRVLEWVRKQRQLQREQAVEDKIREIDAKNSVFNPTIKDLLTEKKDRGLPARKDVRDTVERIEATPYIPETYGKTVYEKGPLFEFESAKGRMPQVLEKEISVHMDNVALEALLLNVSQSSGVNFIADKSLAPLKQVLTVNFEKVKLSEFLRYVGRNYELQFQIGPDLIWVVDAKDPKRIMEETRFYRLRKGFVLPAQFGSGEATMNVARNPANPAQVVGITEVSKMKRFVNDLAPEQPSLEQAIKELFQGSKHMIDYERNLVVARGTPEQLEVIEKLIKEFDQPLQQVLIEARFVTVSKPTYMQLGVIWEMGRSGRPSPVPRDYTGLVALENVPFLGIGAQETFTNVFGKDTLSATLSALEQSGESQTLSAPRLTVINNRPATISDGKVQYYYEEYTTKTTVGQYYTASALVPQGKPVKITSGAELNVLASISGDGRSLVLALNPRVNTDVKLVKFATITDYIGGAGAGQAAVSTFDINLPEYRTQELATRVVIKSGETVAMGGVLEREKSTFVEAVPVLGNLPIIGALFRRRTELDRPRYLLVFVTATILTDSGEFLFYDDEAAVKQPPSKPEAPPQPAAAPKP